MSKKCLLTRLCWFLLSVFALVLAACGGGVNTASGGGVGEEGTGGPYTAASIGVVTGLDDTHVQVNGVQFDRSQAHMSNGLGESLSPSDDLQPGMWVQVSGSRASANGPALADTVKVQVAVRGTVSQVSTDGRELTVLSHTIKLDDDTILVGWAGGSGPLVGDTVEVHGPLGAVNGEVFASRLAKLDANVAHSWLYELRGVVSQLNVQTMWVGTQMVSLNQPGLVLPAELKEGVQIRVASPQPPASSSTPWGVTRVVLDQTPQRDWTFYFADGFVRNWQIGPLFGLEDVLVDARKATSKDTVRQNGQRVAAIGALRQGVLQADSVTVRNSASQAIFSVVGPIRGWESTQRFMVKSVLVDASLAKLSPDVVNQLNNGVVVRVVGPIKGNRLVAVDVKILPAP